MLNARSSSRLASIVLRIGLGLAPAIPATAAADPPVEPRRPAPIEIREGLAISVDGAGRRSPIAADPVSARVVIGDWTMPRAGDEVVLFDGSKKKWEPAQADKDGRFHLAYPNSFLAVEVDLPEDQPRILEAAGHTMVYVNGSPRSGDLYDYGNQRIPITLVKGRNTLLFQSGRGGLRARLVAPRADCELNAGDPTTPDFVVGRAIDDEAAVVVLNSTSADRGGLAIRATIPGEPATVSPLPALIASSARKLGFRIRGAAPAKPGSCDVKIELLGTSGSNGEREVLDAAKFGLRVVQPEHAHKITFRSAIDGSVQYYALLPALADPDRKTSDGSKSRPGLVLTLHGAGVEAIGQAESYAAKRGLNIVAATNRRPFGFDWEDWGRLDALEVLKIARATLDPDPSRIYLTGHSMGGHGTWQIGATFPDRFAAIAPSAGWISMWSYAGASEPDKSDQDPVRSLLARAVKPSDTLALVKNLAQLGVYILHGDADDNVPPEQARRMRQALGGFHPDFVYHEQPGAGHWWGNPCVDWPPLFAFFESRRLPRPETVRRVDFVTASPGVSSSSNWLTIETQNKPMALSEVHFTLDPEHRRFQGTTDNVRRLALDVGAAFASGTATEPVDVEIDGQTLAGLKPVQTAGSNRVWLERSGPTWKTITAPPSLSLKGPHRYGPFKNAFRDRVVFVYGSQGTAEENAWSFAKARYDAETFGYRGNGSIDVLPDSAFLARRAEEGERDRSVILYGHADVNAAWKPLLEDCPIQVARGKVRVGTREQAGDGLACLFVRPRPGSDRASIGVVAATGPQGARLIDRLPYFVSGVGYPDFFLADGDALKPTPRDRPNPGFLAAGYFGEDWSLDKGEFAWRAEGGND